MSALNPFDSVSQEVALPGMTAGGVSQKPNPDEFQYRIGYFQLGGEHGFDAQFTLSCQEAMLPQANGSLQPVLMVLLHGQGFAMPIFHSIDRTATGRLCQLRPFPDLEEFQAVQALLEQRIQQNMTRH